MANKKKITTRKIRGEKRQVEITKKKNGKESIRILDKKKPKKRKTTSKKLSFKEAKRVQKTRSEQARNRDSKSTSKKVIKDERWKKNPGKYDYPKVDTKGYGMKSQKEKEEELKRKKEKEAKRLKDVIYRLNTSKSSISLVRIYNYHYLKIKFPENKKKLKDTFDRNAIRLNAQEKKEAIQLKKDKEKYDRDLENWQKKRQRARDKEYEPQLKEAIKKLNNFQKGDVGLTKLFNREFNKVGTRANRVKLTEAYDRNTRRLRVKHEKRKIKELIRTEKDPERLRRLKESQKIANKSAKKFIKGNS